MISKEEVKHIAKLARLDFNQEEAGKMQKDLAEILTYIELLNEVDVSNTEAFLKSDSPNILRKDQCIPEKEEAVEKIKGQFPERKGNLVKVKEIKWN